MNDFLDIWHQAMFIGAFVALLLAIVMYVYHKFTIASASEYKKKYDIIREKEIRVYQIAVVFIAVGVAMIINTYGKGSLEFDYLVFFVRIFISIAGGTLIGYVGALILKYYYPTRLNKKLQKWRYIPRVNTKTGSKMRLLREDEEDVHLDEGMRAEEEVFSVDYDVWVDEVTGDTKIEKYSGHLEAVQCNNCGFYTMKVIREEIIKEPSPTEDGELIKHYECQYCQSIRATQFQIAKNDNYEGFKPETLNFEKNNSVTVVKVEVHTATGERRSYEFHTVEQAQKFLAEFDLEKAI